MGHSSKPSARIIHSDLSANGKPTQPEASKDEALLPNSTQVGSRGETNHDTIARHATDRGISIVDCLADIPPTEEELIFTELSARNRFIVHDVDAEPMLNESDLPYCMNIAHSYEDDTERTKFRQELLNDERIQAYNDITLDWLEENHPELAKEFETGSFSIA